MNKIDRFIKMLSREIVSEETTNLYFGKSKAARIRTQNLQRYLYRMAELKPTKLLLGEAPGYKGCGKTGIAFSSERILIENSFYKNQGFECLNQDEKLETEISATILWNELDQYAIKPLIWNIFPFHPHSHSNKRSNRTPNSQELEIGKKYLKELLNIYAIEKIIALGRKAELMIKDMGYSYAYVRHPANGGKKEFVRGLKAELK